jgi:glycosyltransferase involved in cell wall biosynthesis
VVPEGVDTQRIDAALESTGLPGRAAPVIDDLRRKIAALPPERHGLPLAVSVGRMHEVKGMARLVEAFAADPDLAGSANLVIVGGDLDAPSETEAAELDRIRDLFELHPGLMDRVVLLGHRPNDDVGHVLAVARMGSGPYIGRAGAYVCGSAKEEFGLALIEAMAAGLPVVAPRIGGPATYVEDGLTGLLVDTTDTFEIASGLRLALRLSQDPETPRRTRATVDARYTLEHMARRLAAVYRIAAGARTLAHPVNEDAAA